MSGQSGSSDSGRAATATARKGFSLLRASTKSPTTAWFAPATALDGTSDSVTRTPAISPSPFGTRTASSRSMPFLRPPRASASPVSSWYSDTPVSDIRRVDWHVIQPPASIASDAASLLSTIRVAEVDDHSVVVSHAPTEASIAAEVERSAVSLAFLRTLVTKLNPGWSSAEVVREYIIPATAATRCRFADTLPALTLGTRPTYFVSHRWSDNFCDMVQRVDRHVRLNMKYEDGEPADPAEIFLWIDVFAVNQHDCAGQLEDLSHIKDAIHQSTHGTLLILDPDGLVFTRIWCLYEIHETLLLESEESLDVAGRNAQGLDVLLPLCANQTESIQRVYGELDVNNAQATVESDRVRILEAIAQSPMDTVTMTQRLKRSIVRAHRSQLQATRNATEQVSIHERVGEMKELMLGAVIVSLQRCAAMLHLDGTPAHLEEAIFLLREAMLLGVQINYPAMQQSYTCHLMGSIAVAKGELDDALACAEHSGSILQQAGDIEEAHGEFEWAHELLLQIHGQDTPHAAIAGSHSRLAGLLQRMGRRHQALHECKAALTMTKALYGDEPHTDVAQCHENVGALLAYMGDLLGALVHSRLSEEIRLELAHGDLEHPSMARIYSQIGGVLHALGRLEPALEMLQLSVRVDTCALGIEHPLVRRGKQAIQRCLDDIDGKRKERQQEKEQELASDAGDEL